jgi:hypothetical protein
VTLSQIVHLSLRRMFEPDANFDRQRRPYAPTSNPCALCDDPHGSVFLPAPTGPCGISLSADNRHAVRCVTERSEAMKDKDRTSEREHQDRLERFLKNAFNTQLQPLRSLETATKKRRAQKKKAASNSGFTRSTTTTSA